MLRGASSDILNQDRQAESGRQSEIHAEPHPENLLVDYSKAA
jgi:hypothetical protein